MIHCHNFLICFGVYLTLVFAAVTVDEEKCDERTCPGPLAYYKAIDCKPVYKKNDSCCAWKYNCSHLEERDFINKCYFNHQVYEIDEELREEDGLPCQNNCVCIEHNGFATFHCTSEVCGTYKFNNVTCYLNKSPENCCAHEKVCVESLDDFPRCNVNGKTLYAGQTFVPNEDPYSYCTCLPGFVEGKYVEPFCKKFQRPYCTRDLYRAKGILNKCAPVYERNQFPQTSCSIFEKCQTENDIVTVKYNEMKLDDNDVCEFGNLTIQIGDEVSTHSDCVNCVCEVPPVPTCYHAQTGNCYITRNT